LLERIQTNFDKFLKDKISITQITSDSLPDLLDSVLDQQNSIKSYIILLEKLNKNGSNSQNQTCFKDYYTDFFKTTELIAVLNILSLNDVFNKIYATYFNIDIDLKCAIIEYLKEYKDKNKNKNKNKEQKDRKNKINILTSEKDKEKEKDCNANEWQIILNQRIKEVNRKYKKNLRSIDGCETDKEKE